MYLVFLHLLPGILYLLAFVCLGKFLHKRGFPVAIPDAIASIFVLISTFFFIITLSDTSVLEILKNQNYVEPSRIMLYAFLSLAWAIGIFLATKKWGDILYKKYFSWFPAYLDLADHISNSTRYSRKLIIAAWALSAIVNSLVAPFAEEIYFRGFLLPQFAGNLIIISIVHTFLFSLYHFWSLWQLPTRVVAIAPMVYLVASTGNIYIGILMHISLNLIGDTILTAPSVFGKQTKNS